MKKKDMEELQHDVDKFNFAFPVGTVVIRYKLINPLLGGKTTKTRSEAWVMVEGVSGGVLLESVVPI